MNKAALFRIDIHSFIAGYMAYIVQKQHHIHCTKPVYKVMDIVLGAHQIHAFISLISVAGA